MKYKYIVTFHTVDNHVIELYNTSKERVDEVDLFLELNRCGYMIGTRYHTGELTFVNMTNVVSAKVRIEEIP